MSKADHVTPKPSVQFWLENYPAKHLAGTETNHDIDEDDANDDEDDVDDDSGIRGSEASDLGHCWTGTVQNHHC